MLAILFTHQALRGAFHPRWYETLPGDPKHIKVAKVKYLGLIPNSRSYKCDVGQCEALQQDLGTGARQQITNASTQEP
jgi:hypothetical protein